MPCGEHVALVRLVTHQGHKHPLDVYADVGFSIDADDADDEAEGGNVGGGECPEGSACDGGCGEHGWCQRGACVCEADWEGEDCSHAVLMNATFMPSVHPLVLALGTETLPSPRDCTRMQRKSDGMHSCPSCAMCNVRLSLMHVWV